MRFVFAFWLFFSAALFAQTPKVDTLPDYTAPIVDVLAQSAGEAFASATSIELGSLRTTQHTRSLTQLLQNESHFFVRQYGLGGLSTVSQRGSSAAQTAIQWEGIDLQNPMLGQADFSLVPLFFIDRAEWHLQASSALAGSSGVGGSIQLFSQQPAEKGFRLSLLMGAGSFSQYHQNFDFSYTAERWALRTRLYANVAENDFLYRDINAFGSPKPLVRMPHNSSRSGAILQEFYVQATESWQFAAKIWLQHTHRLLPPTLLQSSSADEQTDRSLRLTTYAERQKGSSRSRLQQSYVRESLRFQTPALDALSQTNSLQTSLTHRQFLGERHLYELGAQYHYARALSPTGYSEQVQQHRARLSLFYRYNSPNEAWQLSALSRGEYLVGLYPRGALSLQSKYRLSSAWRLQLHAAQNYRLPTLNDWYWSVGGNPLLRPESNRIAEIGFSYLRSAEKSHFWQISAEVQGYFSETRDYIAWLPDERTGLWAVENLGRVQAFGLQTSGRISYCADSNFRLQIAPRYSFTRAYEPINGTKTQLIYVPQHQAQISLQADWRQRIGAFYRQEFASRRRIDERLSLPAYSLSDMGIWANFRAGYMSGQIDLSVHNLFNLDYQAVANRPMPRRWFSLSVRLDLQGAPARARKREG